MGTDQRVTLDDQGDLTVVGICTTCPPCTHHWWDSVNSRVIHAGTPEDLPAFVTTPAVPA